jgi:hypothetical protein
MLHVRLALILILAASALSGCAVDPVEAEFRITHVTTGECAEITAAFKKFSPERVRACQRFGDRSPQGVVTVITEADHTFAARKIRGKWHFEKTIILV